MLGKPLLYPYTYSTAQDIWQEVVRARQRRVWNQEVIQWLKAFLLSEGSSWISALWLWSLFHILDWKQAKTWMLSCQQCSERQACCWDLWCCGGDPTSASVCNHLLFPPQFPGPPWLSPFFEGWWRSQSLSQESFWMCWPEYKETD